MAFASGARQLWTAGSPPSVPRASRCGRPVTPTCCRCRTTTSPRRSSTTTSSACRGTPPTSPPPGPHPRPTRGAAGGDHRRRPRVPAAGRRGAGGRGRRRQRGGVGARSPEERRRGRPHHVAPSRRPGSALAAMVDALRPGATERGLVAIYLEAIAPVGAPTPPTEGVACATPSRGPVALRRIATGPRSAGQLVVLDPGATTGLRGGDRPPADWGRRPIASGRWARRCRSPRRRPRRLPGGATGGDLVAAWASCGEALPAVPLAHGVGLGVEPPIIGPRRCRERSGAGHGPRRHRVGRRGGRRRVPRTGPGARHRRDPGADHEWRGPAGNGA